MDDDLQKHILSKHIWVYGETGIGKSELLRRTLVENDVEHIYIDLSLCDHNNVDAMFMAMYETICEYMGLDLKNGLDFQSTIKCICNQINDYKKKQQICLFIAIPIKMMEVYGDKIKNFIHFVAMEKWDMDECKSLVNLLSKIVSLQWESEKTKQDFIERADFSPRRIKSRLKECCSLEIGKINESIINKLFTE